MIKRCNGLPLAVGVLGGVLATKHELSEWEMVHRTMTRFKGELDEILLLSYNELPNQMLKHCFVSLCKLPYRFEFDADKLLQWWMAENAISLYVAEVYLKELARRSMVEVQVDEFTGRAKSFRLHKFFQSLCWTLKNVPLERHIYEVIDFREPHLLIYINLFKNRKVAYNLNNLDDLYRHSDSRNRYSESKIALNFRSVVFYVDNHNRRSRIPRMVESQLGQLKLVRVLDLGGLVLSKLDRVVGKLKLLNYLSLRYSVFHELPSTVRNMEHLQTLDLWGDNTPYGRLIIPNVFGQMRQLKHLYLRRSVWSNKGRDRLLQLPSQLEILVNFDSRVLSVTDLLNLTNLRELEVIICSKSDLKKITQYLLNSDASKQLWRFTLSIKYCDLYSEEGQQLLQEVLSCNVLHELSVDGRTGLLPHYNNSFSQCLTKITLESCHLKEDPMAMLENFSNLRSLFLKWNAFVAVEMVCSATGFPQLRILQLWRIRNLENWRVDKGAMPKLSSLEITSCPNLKMLPEGLKFINTLKRLVIRWMPEAFTNRLLQPEDGKGGGEDLNKVQHAYIQMTDYNGNTVARGVHENNDAATEGGVVIRDSIGKPSRTSSHNSRPDKGKGKAPMT